MASWINHPSRYSLFLSRPLMNTGPFRREATLSSPVAFPRLYRFLLNPARFPFKGDFPQGPSLHGRYPVSSVLCPIWLPDRRPDGLAVTLVHRYSHSRKNGQDLPRSPIPCCAMPCSPTPGRPPVLCPSRGRRCGLLIS